MFRFIWMLNEFWLIVVSFLSTSNSISFCFCFFFFIFVLCRCRQAFNTILSYYIFVFFLTLSSTLSSLNLIEKCERDLFHWDRSRGYFLCFSMKQNQKLCTFFILLSFTMFYWTFFPRIRKVLRGTRGWFHFCEFKTNKKKKKKKSFSATSFILVLSFTLLSLASANFISIFFDMWPNCVYMPLRMTSRASFQKLPHKSYLHNSFYVCFSFFFSVETIINRCMNCFVVIVYNKKKITETIYCENVY